jgi:hypothetical protein
MLTSALRATVGLLVLCFTLSAQALEFPFVPNERLTAGSLCDPRNPDFAGYRYSERIAYCRRNVEGWRKAEIYEVYGVSQKCAGQYIIDHFIPLSMGGSNAAENLWPEANIVRALRASLEQDTFDQLSAGEITQAEAVEIIVRAKLNPPVRDPWSYKFCR